MIAMAGPAFKVEFRDVTLSFEDQTVLDGVSFGVRPGALKGILGGSGKSTVLKLALGLIQPDAGQVLIDGKDITTLDETGLNQMRRRLGMVFQEGALFTSLTVDENVAFRPQEMGWDEARVNREVKRVLEFVGLLDAYEIGPCFAQPS